VGGTVHPRAGGTWYARFGAPLLLQLPDPHPLDGYFGTHGWQTLHHGLGMYRQLPKANHGRLTPRDANVTVSATSQAAAVHATLDGQVAGTGEVLRLELPGAGAVAVGSRSVFTAEQFRRRGVATAVVAAAEDLAPSAGAAGVVLLVRRDNEPAIRLYQRLGYTAHHEYRFLQEPS